VWVLDLKCLDLEGSFWCVKIMSFTAYLHCQLQQSFKLTDEVSYIMLFVQRRIS